MPSEKGRANMLRTLSSFEKYKTNIDDVSIISILSGKQMQFAIQNMITVLVYNSDYVT